MFYKQADGLWSLPTNEGEGYWMLLYGKWFLYRCDWYLRSIETRDDKKVLDYLLPYHPRENSRMMSLRFSIEHNISLPVTVLITAPTVLHYNMQNCVGFRYSLLTARDGLPLLLSVQASLLQTSLKLGNK